jgi:hypothetical protein
MILVSTPRINTLSDWSLRRGAGGGNKYAFFFEFMGFMIYGIFLWSVLSGTNWKYGAMIV